jgi:trehalose utilization protein
MIRVSIYNDYIHEQKNEKVAEIYPEGIHGAIANFLNSDDITCRCFTLDTVNDITDEVLAETDVMIWWSHSGWRYVPDEVTNRVQLAVLGGMGIIFLHSSHNLELFRRLMGTGGRLSWRINGDKERIWNINPSHPIAQGIDHYFELPHEEIYSEPFGIPNPDEIIFIGSYEHGEVFRSGFTLRRENGKIFYFQPGHEDYPTFYDKNVQTIIRNAVYWTNPTYRHQDTGCPMLTKTPWVKPE